MRSKPMFGTLLLLTALSGCPSGEPQTGASGKLTGEVRATTIGEIPLSDPLSAAWNGTPETSVMLLPQTVAYPNLIKQSVKELRVRALADAQFLAVRLEWNDPSLDEKLEVDKFTDGVAVEVPLGDPDKTNPMMGDPANPVFILHWKAAWQRDVDRGRADVQDYHPGFISDRPPFVSGGTPIRSRKRSRQTVLDGICPELRQGIRSARSSASGRLRSCKQRALDRWPITPTKTRKERESGRMASGRWCWRCRVSLRIARIRCWCREKR
jgi:hypothetical protein